jgi:uncharacterized protein YbaA (DUF1428 family)
MSYVDGFVVPVPKAKLEEYRKFSERTGKLCKKHGAVQYLESVADDVQPGKVTSFPQAVQLKPDEVVMLSWVIYKSREDRDRINKLVMEEMEKVKPEDWPFDGKRMFMGGFKPILEM